jgi:hypothetical protein
VVSHQNEIFLLIPRSLLRGGFIKEKLVKALEILIEIDKLLKKLAAVDPYGDMLENFAGFPTKYLPVTKRLIRMVRKDLRDFDRG